MDSMTARDFIGKIQGNYTLVYHHAQAKEILSYLGEMKQDVLPYLFEIVKRSFSNQFGRLPDVAVFESYLPQAFGEYHNVKYARVALPPPKKKDDSEPYLDRDEMAKKLHAGIRDLAKAKSIKDAGIGKPFDYSIRDHGIAFADAAESAKFVGVDENDHGMTDVVDNDRGLFDRTAKRKRICDHCIDDLYNCSCEPKGYPLAWKPGLKAFRFVPCELQIKKEREDREEAAEKKKESFGKKSKQWENHKTNLSY